MKLQQTDLLGSEETPIADALRSAGAEYVTKVTQADFKGSQASGRDGYFPQLRSVITQDHEKAPFLASATTESAYHGSLAVCAAKWRIGLSTPGIRTPKEDISAHLRSFERVRAEMIKLGTLECVRPAARQK